jgi:hexosaminidase
LKAVNSWVFLPTNINIESSLDGKNYEFLVSSNGDNSDHHYLVKSIPFVFEFDDIHARYLRITAKSMKTCPEWHRGFGKPSWIFIDEIIVN